MDLGSFPLFLTDSHRKSLTGKDFDCWQIKLRAFFAILRPPEDSDKCGGMRASVGRGIVAGPDGGPRRSLIPLNGRRWNATVLVWQERTSARHHPAPERGGVALPTDFKALMRPPVHLGLTRNPLRLARAQPAALRDSAGTGSRPIANFAAPTAGRFGRQASPEPHHGHSATRPTPVTWTMAPARILMSLKAG